MVDDQNFDSVPDSGILGPECYNWGFAAPPVFEWRTFTHRPISTAPPPLRSRPNTIGEGLSIVFEPLHLKEKPIQGSLSWVAFKLKKKRPKSRPLRRNFGSHSGLQPNSDPWATGTATGICNLVRDSARNQSYSTGSQQNTSSAASRYNIHYFRDRRSNFNNTAAGGTTDAEGRDIIICHLNKQHLPSRQHVFTTPTHRWW